MLNNRFGMRRLFSCGVILAAALACLHLRPKLDNNVEQGKVDDLVRRGRRACEDDATVNSLLPDDKWERYQFVDYFKGVLIEGADEQWKQRNWESYETGYPGSLMEAYHRAALKEGKFPGDADLLKRIVQERAQSTAGDDLSPENTLVIHPRLGDVVDAAVESVAQLLLSQRYFYRATSRPGKGNACRGMCEDPWVAPDNPELREEWNAYVRPLSYYRGLLARFDGRFTNVTLMGAAHLGQQHGAGAQKVVPTKSCIYTHALKSFFQEELGMDAITLRLGRPPDDDILYASHAKAYVQAGGGFPKLLGDLAVQFGGEVLPERD